MPQSLLPLVPDGATPICDHISVVNENDTWTYFAGVLPVFSHPRDDRNSFRMFTAQLVCNGICKQVDIVKTFGVAPVSVKRSVKQYREQGSKSFYQPRRGRGATVMTDQLIQQAQELLNQGYSRKETAQKLKIKLDTLRKASTKENSPNVPVRTDKPTTLHHHDNRTTPKPPTNPSADSKTPLPPMALASPARGWSNACRPPSDCCPVEHPRDTKPATMSPSAACYVPCPPSNKTASSDTSIAVSCR